MSSHYKNNSETMDVFLSQLKQLLDHILAYLRHYLVKGSQPLSEARKLIDEILSRSKEVINDLFPYAQLSFPANLAITAIIDFVEVLCNTDME